MKLIKAGADITIRNCINETALHLAARKFHDVAHLLIQMGAEVDAFSLDDYNTPLHEAVIHSDYEMVSMFLHHDADPGYLSSGNLSALMLAVDVNADVEMQKLLLEYEVDLNRTSEHGDCTLLLALKRQSPIVMDIIEKGGGLTHFTDARDTLAVLLNYPDTDVFKAVWSKCSRDIILECDVVLHTLLDVGLPPDIWLERVNVIFNSHLACDIVGHYVRVKQMFLFSTLIYAFIVRRLPESDLYSIMCICLSYGPPVYLSDVEVLYNCYGYNETMKLLLQMNVEIVNQANYLSVPFLICNVRKRRLKGICRQRVPGTPGPSPRQVNRVKQFCTFSYMFKKQFHEYCEYLRICRRADWEAKVLNKRIVPSLVELSRNAARRAISSQFNVTGTASFYTIVNQLDIPDVVRKIITFEMPVCR